MTAKAKLEKLRAKLGEARGNEREVGGWPEKLRAELDALGERLTSGEFELPADGSPPPASTEAGKLWREQVSIRGKLDGPWDARLEKAGRERAEVEAEHARFVVDNLGELLAEVEPDAKAAQEVVVAALDDLSAAIAGWHDVRSLVSSLLSPVPGISGADIPRPPFEAIGQELRRLRAEEIPAPLPGTFYDADGAGEAHARAVEAAVTSDE